MNVLSGAILQFVIRMANQVPPAINFKCFPMNLMLFLLGPPLSGTQLLIRDVHSVMKLWDKAINITFLLLFITTKNGIWLTQGEIEENNKKNENDNLES